MDNARNLRLKNLTLAVLGAVVTSTLTAYCHFTDRLIVGNLQIAIFLGLFWCGNLFFVWALTSDFSQKFVDNSLSQAQMYWGYTTTLFFMSICRAFAEPFFFLMLIINVFGVFRLTPTKFNVFGIYASMTLGIQEIWEYHYFQSGDSKLDIFINWGAFTFCIFVLSSLCKSMSILRTRLKQRNASLKEALDTKSMFLANMSHEIRTPINGVMGMLKLLEKTEISKQQENYLKIAYSSSQALSFVINDILDFSKAEAGKLEIEALEFDIQELLSATVKSHAYDAQSKKLALILDSSRVTKVYVNGDAIRLQQILNNLISNAIKFTAYGEVLVEVELTEKSNEKLEFRCTVSDSGVGIPAEKLNGIFESFSQVDESTTRKFGGTGLGLAIVKKLCALMNGNVQVDSDLNKGSCFSFNIELEPADKNTANYGATNTLEGHRIFIVDNHTKSADAIKNQLEMWEGALIELLSPDELVHKLEVQNDRRQMWLVIDRSMTNNFELIRETRRKNRSINIILLTTLDTIVSDEEKQDLNIRLTIAKPVTAKDLFEGIVAFSSQHNQAFTDASHQPKMHARNWASVHTDTIHVLVVEDNLINQEVACGLLSSINITCDVVENGAEAVEVVKTAGNKYNLILMDCQMPVMDGYKATAAIRSGEAGDSFKNIPIIALTANTLNGDKQRCIDAGMNDYLGKPVDTGEFEQKIRFWIKPKNKNMAL